MTTERMPRLIASIVVASALMVAAAGTGLAQRSGAAPAHGAAGAHAGGAPRAGGGGAAPGRGSYGGGYRGGYSGYGYGSRGYGWGSRWGWGAGYGWGWGWPLGVYIASLPLYYSTLWWGGIPYYYADGNYYAWDDSVGEYQQIEPPGAVAQQATGAPAGSMELFAYPKSGQSDSQQASDKAECRRWAEAQSGFDPAASNAMDARRQDYLRAEAACLEGRGYSVE
ncbi:MAG TPA: hypothetical protein VMU67_09305 [Steroidobacteraceae bacterium]|nr:hypothetical protein [Steroidobacteraceae bacterium]